jgi:uncharacterized protein (DUF433 family)
VSPWKLEFFEVAQGSAIGTVTFDGTTMTVEGALSGLVDGRSPDDVLDEGGSTPSTTPRS